MCSMSEKILFILKINYRKTKKINAIKFWKKKRERERER